MDEFDPLKQVESTYSTENVMETPEHLLYSQEQAGLDDTVSMLDTAIPTQSYTPEQSENGDIVNGNSVIQQEHISNHQQLSQQKAVDDRCESPSKSAFSFQAFLDKMRQPDAYTLVKSMKNFIAQHSKPVSDVNATVMEVHQFIDEMVEDISNHALWEGCSEDDLEYASEGVEKYLLSKLYRYVFQPHGGDEVMKDQAINHRMHLLSFIKPEHLDIPSVCAEQTEALGHAGTELIKMDSYKAPRDKVICVLNAVKVLHRVLESSHGQDERTSADDFFPLLVYVILRSNPPNLWSNIHFIQNFRHPSRLRGETAYYMTNLDAAARFIESLNADRLSINQSEFDDHLESILATAPKPEPSQQQHQLAKPTRPPPPRPGGNQNPSDVSLSTNDTSSSSSSSSSSTTTTTATGVGSSISSALRSFMPSISFGSRTPKVSRPESPTSSTSTTLQSQASSTPHNQESVSGHPTSVQMPHNQPSSSSSSSSHVPPSSYAPSSTPQPSPPHGLDPELEELLRACQEPSVAHFLNCDVNDLTLGDIPLLLADYRRLASLKDRLARVLALNVEIETTTTNTSNTI